MRTHFESLLEEVIPELNLLSTAHADVVPGVVLASKEDDRIIADLRHHIPEELIAQDQWQTELVEANALFPEDLEGSDGGELATRFLRFLGLDLERSNDVALEFHVSDFRVRKFCRGLDPLTLAIAIRQFRRHERRAWKKLLRRYLVSETWYAKTVAISAVNRIRTGFDLSTELRKVNVDAELEVVRESASAVRLEARDGVPFGVTGFQIRRFRLAPW